ncbi:MAG: glycosyltransferase family 1 protein [Fibrobacterota bacterium]|nr:MAG: glycosyltransferase family 1 protein [Fibrobacterota bacterium]
MRILLAPVGTEGDVRPVATLATALARAGHDPLLLVAPDFVDLCRSLGAHPTAMGQAFRPKMDRLSQDANGRPWTAWKALMKGLREGVSDQFREIAPQVEGVDLFVGTALQFSIHSFADRLGVPSCQVGHVPMLVQSRFHAPPNFPRSLGVFNPVAWRLVYRSLEWALRKTMDRERIRMGLDPLKGSFKSHFERPFLLAMDPELAPLPPDAPPRIAQCGYLRDPEASELSDEIESFLRAGTPPVYIGFGSMVESEVAVLGRIVCEAVHKAGVRAIVARGWTNLEAQGERILSVGHVPHLKLFPRCAAVVHHGGAGTSWAVSRSGVPQVVVPHLMDQPWWSRRLSQLAVAADVVPHAKLGVDRLALAITRAVAMEPTPCRNLSRSLASRDGPQQAADLIASWARKRP